MQLIAQQRLAYGLLVFSCGTSASTILSILRWTRICRARLVAVRMEPAFRYGTGCLTGR